MTAELNEVDGNKLLFSVEAFYGEKRIGSGLHRRAIIPIKPQLPEAMQNKVCLITGATSGIGKAAALELAWRGAIVVGVGRNPAKCEAAARQIEEATGNRPDFLLADLSSQADLTDDHCGGVALDIAKAGHHGQGHPQIGGRLIHMEPTSDVNDDVLAA